MPQHGSPQIIPAIPTPFRSDGALNLDGTKAMLAAVHDSGVDAIFAGGTTGEFATMSDEERLQLLDACLEVFPAHAIYFHAGSASAYQAVRLAVAAASRGATRLAAITPYYLPPSHDGVVAYYRQIVDAVPNAEVYAYLFQARTSAVSRPEVLSELAAVGVRGVKISGESTTSVQAFLDAAPEGFTVLSGDDASFGWLLRQGGQGIVSGVSAVFPQPFVDLRDAFVAGDEAAAAVADAQVQEVVAAFHSGSVAHLKAGLVARGIDAGPPRSAVEPAPAADIVHIAELVARYAG